jgi:hypothetical protein
MDSRKGEIEEDLQELQRLVSLTTNTRVVAVLTSAVAKLQEELRLLPVAVVQPEPVAPIPSDMVFRPIEKFAYEQEGKNLKVYVTCLPSLKSHPQNKLVVAFTRESLDIKVLDLESANYRFYIKQLMKPITDCRLKTSSSGFTLAIKKEENSHWDSLAFKPSAVSKPKDKKDGESADPGAGLMDMMREMYQNVSAT